VFVYIKRGSENMGGNMTGYEGALTDGEIHDIILWLRSLWPGALRERWNEKYGGDKRP